MTTRGPAKKHGMARRIGVAAFAVAGFLAAPSARAECPPNCIGQTLTTPNFSHQDLTGADFTGATLIGAVFIRANLTAAKFDNAKFQFVPGFPTQTPDFSFANLTRASFKGAQFESLTYLTYATLTCADFSRTNINNGNAIFGEGPLISDPSATCADGKASRTKFQSTIMSCEFINDWKAFDLTGAVVTACVKQLSARDFSGAILSGVDLTGAVLDGDLFVKTDLTRAVLNNASLQCLVPGNPEGSKCVDMTGALLQGAFLNNANLSGATLYGAFLSNNTNDTITDAANVQQAHLKNVNLATAQLSGVDFSLSNFYGNSPANPGGCRTTGGSDLSGFTKGCATASGSTMTGTKFINSYLYGLDLTDAKITGANFYQAILVGANFGGAKIKTFVGDASVTNFFRAYMQGTNLEGANSLTEANLSNAFYDFRSGGNILSIALSSSHNQFARCSGPPTVCKVPAGQDVCVFVRYPLATIPSSNTTITCPKGSPAGSNGCGTDISPATSLWKSNLTIGTPPDGSGIPPGSYSNDATFEPQPPDSAVCNKKGTSARVIDW
jgi:uncharacterized protein YjbI with pentapeptide repeats